MWAPQRGHMSTCCQRGEWENTASSGDEVSLQVVMPRSRSLAPPSRWHHTGCERLQGAIGRGPTWRPSKQTNILCGVEPALADTNSRKPINCVFTIIFKNPLKTHLPLGWKHCLSLYVSAWIYALYLRAARINSRQLLLQSSLLSLPASPPSHHTHTHTCTHTLFQMVLANASRNPPLHKDKVVVFHPFLLQSAAKKLIFSHVNPRLRNTWRQRGVFIETALTCNLFFFSSFPVLCTHAALPAHCLKIQYQVYWPGVSNEDITNKTSRKTEY